MSNCGEVRCPGGERPAIDNVMSYYHCGSRFSPEQRDFVRCTLTEELAAYSRAASCVPRPESCDGLDEDCDGRVDEEISPEPCGIDVGRCARGQRTCRGGVFGACEGAVEPGPETCNGEDDDCDGRLDEDLDPRLAPLLERCPDRGVCAGGRARDVCVRGTWRCALPPDHQPEECPPVDPACALGDARDESCRDGLDNDCDGVRDENNPVVRCEDDPLYPQLGSACFASHHGPCGVQGGTYRCVALAEGCGVRVDCVGAVFPEDEQCDGRDRDCNGLVDDADDRDGDGYGVCPGRTDCDEARADVHPGAAEVCNDIDDDCNGLVDEGCPAAIARGALNRGPRYGNDEFGPLVSTDCPAGQVIVGMAGASGSMVDRLAPLCATLVVEREGVGAPQRFGVRTADLQWMPAFGGPGGGAFEFQCPPGQAIVAVRLRSGAQVDAISFACGRLDVAGERGSFALRISRTVESAFWGGNGGQEHQYSCPDGHVAAGFSARGVGCAGPHCPVIDQFGLDCAPVAVVVR